MQKPNKPFLEWTEEEHQEFREACNRVESALTETGINWGPLSVGTIIMLDNLFKEEMNGLRSKYNKREDIR